MRCSLIVETREGFDEKKLAAVGQTDLFILVVWFVAWCRVVYDSSILFFGILPDDTAELNNFYGSYAVWIFIACFFSAMIYPAVKDFTASFEPDGSAPDDATDEEKIDDSLSSDELDDSESDDNVRDISSFRR